MKTDTKTFTKIDTETSLKNGTETGTKIDTETGIKNGMKTDTETGMEPARGEGQRRVSINFCGSTPLMWRVSDIKSARQEAGVVGTMVGALVRQPRQNVRLGRPLEILHEDARALMEEHSATARTQHPTPVCESEESRLKEVELYKARLEDSYREQRALALEDKKAVLQRVLNEKQNGNEERSVRERLESLEKNFSFPRSAMSIQLSTARAGFSHCAEEHHYLAADWPLPRDERSETRFRVYKDLRRRGFYLTSAGKFGGDYLVYPGDPLRFHAHFIALCLAMEEQLILSDVFAIARLGSNVKKTVLLCSPRGPSDGETEEAVVYSSLQWSGIV